MKITPPSKAAGSRHRVVLYNPKAVFFDLPLALIGIGSALDPERFEVLIFDARVDNRAAERAVLAAAGALCFGITTLTGAPLRDALAVSRRVQQEEPGVPVVWGGWHASLFPLETLQDEASVTVTVQAQGESTFRELCACLEQGMPLASVNGLSFREQDGTTRKNPPRALEAMDDLPRYNYDLIDVERYFSAKGRRQFDYFSSTGCPFRCAFCADPFVFKRRWSAVSPKRVGEELSYWHKRFSFDDLNFQDETFFTYRERSLEIAEQLITRNLGITWAATMRADQAHRLSEADFATLRRSGLRRVLIGVESGSQQMMDWMKKDIRIEHVWEAAERCKRFAIAAIFPFIVGFPNETLASFEASLDMAHRLRSMSPSFTTPIFYFKPYPGSAITQEVVKNGFRLPQSIEEWADFDYIGSSGPWVSEQRFREVERFKFYNQVAGRKPRLVEIPLQQLARWRVRHRRFGFPFEQELAKRLRPSAQLS